jgi:large subunit ribosomal protein L31
MKKDIHPDWYPEAKVICSCGATYTMGATQETIRTDVCSSCHPFFTGEQRIVDSEGQVQRFMKRLEKRQELIQEAPSDGLSKEERRRQKRAVIEIVEEEKAEEEEENKEEQAPAE